MTHAQKPEFRTREAQLERMREMFYFPDADALNERAARVMTRLILEAEARGAAEQRRKDAEGNRRVGYLHILLMENGQELEDFSTYDESELVFPDLDPLHSVRVEPVYIRPANVAALEARVKELEREICSIRERVKGAASSVMGIRTDAMNGDNLAITLASYFEDLLGEHDPNGWHPGAQKACDEIEAAIVAHMAAAIREGGER